MLGLSINLLVIHSCACLDPLSSGIRWLVIDLLSMKSSKGFLGGAFCFC